MEQQKEKNTWHKPGKAFLIILTLVLFALLLIAIGWFIRNASMAYRGGELEPRYVYQHDVDLHTPDVSTIRVWMTFAYINVVFKLPPQYLQTILAIPPATKYPNVSLQRYARYTKQSPETVLQNVMDAIRGYQLP